MGRVITSPGVLKNVQGQIDHVTDLYQDIKNNNLKPLTITIDPVTNANGEYTHTTEDDRITEDMKALTLEVGTPEVFSAPITITSGDGEVTLYCADAHGTSTVTVTFIHTWPVDGGEDVPESVTSTEFDILADRIGVLSNLSTTDKSDIVHAVNEINEQLGDITNLNDTENFTTDLDDIPVNGMGRVKLDSSISPTSNDLSVNFIASGDASNKRSIIAVDCTTNKEYKISKNGTWGSWGCLDEQMANLPEIKNVSYTTTENIQVPANGMKEIGTAATVLGDAARLVLAGLIIANGYEKLILGMNRYGSTVYVVARNIEGTAKTIASGTTITFVTYKG